MSLTRVVNQRAQYGNVQIATPSLTLTGDQEDEINKTVEAGETKTFEVAITPAKVVALTIGSASPDIEVTDNNGTILIGGTSGRQLLQWHNQSGATNPLVAAVTSISVTNNSATDSAQVQFYALKLEP